MEPFAGPSSMAMGDQPMPLRYPLCKRLSKGGVRGFLFTLWSSGEIIVFSKHIDYNLIYYPTRLPPNDRFVLPLCSPCGLQLPSFTSFVAPACFWLVVVWFSFVGGHLRPQRIFVVVFFLLICRSKQRDNTPPHVPSRLPLLFNTPPTIDANFLVGCCVPPSNGGHLRQRVLPSLNFFCQLISHPKQRATVLPTHSNPASPLLQCTL